MIVESENILNSKVHQLMNTYPELMLGEIARVPSSPETTNQILSCHIITLSTVIYNSVLALPVEYGLELITARFDGNYSDMAEGDAIDSNGPNGRLFSWRGAKLLAERVSSLQVIDNWFLGITDRLSAGWGMNKFPDDTHPPGDTYSVLCCLFWIIFHWPIKALLRGNH